MPTLKSLTVAVSLAGACLPAIGGCSRGREGGSTEPTPDAAAAKVDADTAAPPPPKMTAPELDLGVPARPLAEAAGPGPRPPPANACSLARLALDEETLKLPEKTRQEVVQVANDRDAVARILLEFSRSTRDDYAAATAAGLVAADHISTPPLTVDKVTMGYHLGIFESAGSLSIELKAPKGARVTISDFTFWADVPSPLPEPPAKAPNESRLLYKDDRIVAWPALVPRHPGSGYFTGTGPDGRNVEVRETQIQSLEYRAPTRRRID